MRISNRKREIRRNIFLFEVSVKSNSHDKRKNAKKKKTSVLITLLNSIKFASLIDELIVPNLKKKKRNKGSNPTSNQLLQVLNFHHKNLYTRGCHKINYSIKADPVHVVRLQATIKLNSENFSNRS